MLEQSPRVLGDGFNICFKGFIPSQSSEQRLPVKKLQGSPVVEVKHTKMLHVWHIYLHLCHFWVNVGKYCIHGASGIVKACESCKTLGHLLGSQKDPAGAQSFNIIDQ
jgi:hypothetical protein